MVDDGDEGAIELETHECGNEKGRGGGGGDEDEKDEGDFAMVPGEEATGHWRKVRNSANLGVHIAFDLALLRSIQPRRKSASRLNLARLLRPIHACAHSSFCSQRQQVTASKTCLVCSAPWSVVVAPLTPRLMISRPEQAS